MPDPNEDDVVQPSGPSTSQPQEVEPDNDNMDPGLEIRGGRIPKEPDKEPQEET
jgi:hypothetical protein